MFKLPKKKKKPLDIAHDDLMDQDNVTAHNNEQVFRSVVSFVAIYCFEREKTPRVPFTPLSLWTHYTRLRGSCEIRQMDVSKTERIFYNKEFRKG